MVGLDSASSASAATSARSNQKVKIWSKTKTSQYAPLYAHGTTLFFIEEHTGCDEWWYHVEDDQCKIILSWHWSLCKNLQKKWHVPWFFSIWGVAISVIGGGGNDEMSGGEGDDDDDDMVDCGGGGGFGGGGDGGWLSWEDECSMTTFLFYFKKHCTFFIIFYLKKLEQFAKVNWLVQKIRRIRTSQWIKSAKKFKKLNQHLIVLSMVGINAYHTN